MSNTKKMNMIIKMKTIMVIMINKKIYKNKTNNPKKRWTNKFINNENKKMKIFINKKVQISYNRK